MMNLERTERVVTKAMCAVELIEKRSSQEPKDVLALEETQDRLSQSERNAMV